MVTRPMPSRSNAGHLSKDALPGGGAVVARRWHHPIGFCLPGDNADELAEQLLVAALCRELLPTSASQPARRLTCVICTKDRPDLVTRCLASLLPLEDSGVEILVIDNAPSDKRTFAAVAAYPQVRYVVEPRA